MSATHILVLGASGPLGLEFCAEALARGYQLTIYVRNPSKLPGDISGHSKVTVIKGSLDDEESLGRAIASNATVFVSFLGPAASSTGTPITDAIKKIFPLLIARHYERALVLCTPSFVAPQDVGSVKWKMLVALIKVIGGSAYEEFSKLGGFVASQDAAQLKWTVFRVPMLGNGPEKPVHTTFAGSGHDGMLLTRKSIVAWVLKEMKVESEWIGKAPLLTN